MKTEPTAIDREAARLFMPAGGMRATWDGASRHVWDRLRDGTEATPDAFDTDDQATTGAMEWAIIESLGGMPDIWGVHYHCDGGWVVELNDSHYYGATKGAALVAAKRAIEAAA